MFIFHGNFSKDIHQRSQLLCFTQNDHTGHAGFKICPFLKWAQSIYCLCGRKQGLNGLKWGLEMQKKGIKGPEKGLKCIQKG